MYCYFTTASCQKQRYCYFLLLLVSKLLVRYNLYYHKLQTANCKVDYVLLR
jgi:hypothetical protein